MSGSMVISALHATVLEMQLSKCKMSDGKMQLMMNLKCTLGYVMQLSMEQCPSNENIFQIVAQSSVTWAMSSQCICQDIYKHNVAKQQ